MCAAIVQLYRTYSLYYLVLCVSSDSCALYLYYFSSLTQILRALAAPMQLVPSTASHRPLLLNSQCWSFRSNANDGAPIPTPANIFPSISPPSHQSPIQFICPIHPLSNQTEHKIHFILENPGPIPIRSSQYYPAYKIHTIQSGRVQNSHRNKSSE